MSLTHQLIKVAAQGSDVDSDIIYCQHRLDEAGLYQVTVTGGDLTNCFFYGRLGTSHTWERVATSGAVSTSTGNSSEAGKGVKSDSPPIYPQMYVAIDVGSSVTCVVTIME